MMRERLARIAAKQYALEIGENRPRPLWPEVVDATLREMMEPGDETIAAGIPIGSTVPFSEYRAVFRAQVQHILDEGRSIKIPHRGKVNTDDHRTT